MKIQTFLLPVNQFVLTILLAPTFWGILGAGGITAGQLIYTLLVLAIGCALTFFHRRPLIVPKTILLLFAVLLGWYGLSLAQNTCFVPSTIHIGDFSELSRPIIYLLSFSIAYSLFSAESDLKYVPHFMIGLIIGLSVLDVLKFTPLGVQILKLYTHLTPGSFNYLRFSGTFAYCYNYAFALIWGMLLVLFFDYKVKILVPLFASIILLTGSRSAMLAMAVALLLYYFRRNSMSKALGRIAVTLLAVAVAVYLIRLMEIPIVEQIFANFEKLIAGITGTAEDGSLTTRNSQLEHTLKNFEHNPLLGVGPQKGDSRPIEIQMGYYLSSWGIGGVMIYLGLMLYFLYVSAKTARLAGSGVVRNFSMANNIWIISSFIIGMSTPITDQVRASQLFYLVQGLQYSLYLVEKQNNAKKILS